MTDAELERRLQAATLRLRGREPFFAALALFTRPRLRDDVPTAGTDGRDLYWNREFLASLPPAQVEGVLLHEVLHAALLHVTRRGPRLPLRWNVACDIVVNTLVDAAGLPLPPGAVRKPEWAHLSVEEVYELLGRADEEPELPHGPDLLGDGEGAGIDGHHALEAHWQQALAQARTLAHGLGQDALPAGLRRELDALSPAALDWRSHLWRYLVRTPTDFTDFDRRLIHRGLYLESLDGETLRVFVALDTSGSIPDDALRAFVSELDGILRAYPHLVCDLYWADAALNGPHRLTGADDLATLPKPVGGGGTDFRPFFVAVERELARTGERGVCVYATDGHGTFPDPPPPLPTLWLVTPGGKALGDFPFGEATRLLAAG